jgi:hypothetical protein
MARLFTDFSVREGVERFLHDSAGFVGCCWALHKSPGIASDTSAKAALAQSTSFCTVDAPVNPIAPTTSPFI